MGITCFIYKIIDPRDRKAFYVGKSVNPGLRFSQHLAATNKTKVGLNIKNLIDKGLIPVFVIIEECEKSIGIDRENFWITNMTKEGHTLLNVRTKGVHNPKFIIEFENGVNQREFPSY